MPKTRTFVAVEAVDEAHAAALAVIDRLRTSAEGIRWVAPDTLHWTLAFLGDLDDREMAEVCLRTVRVAARHEPFELEARGVSAFPSIRRPRTIWIGAGEGSAQLRALQADLEESFHTLGFRGEGRGYTPHLTIGKAGHGGGPGAPFTERLAKLADFDGGLMSVDEAIVFASELTREGPIYSVLARAPLGAA